MRTAWAVLLSSLIILGPGCSSWKAMEPPGPSAQTEDPLPARIRIRLRNQAVFVVHEPRIVGDSLFGIREVTPEVKPSLFVYESSRESLAVALKDLRAIEERRADAGKTAVLLFPVAVIVGLAIWFAAAFSSGDY